MKFTRSERQQMVAETVRKFAQKHIAPNVIKWDNEQYFPAELFPEMGKLGLTGMLVPEEYGGPGLTYFELIDAIIELAKVDPSIALSVAAHNSLCTGHILLFGNEEQKKKWLPKLASGEWIGAWALTEPESGSDAASLRTKAERDGDYWILNGAKTFITHGKSGHIVVVMARTGKGRDITAFAVERGTPGMYAGRKEDKLGMRSSETTEVIFDNCRIPDQWRIGQVGEGFKQAMAVLDGGRIGIAALGIGIALGAYERAKQYAKERKQFGKPIAQFQGIAFKLAEMATNIDAALQLTYKAAQEKIKKGKGGKWASMAKYFASEVAVQVANEAVQIHGGYGYIKEFIVEKFYRDAKLTTIGEGTSEIQKLIISREILAEIGYKGSK